MAVRHLYESGRRRIAFLGWPKSSGLGEDRVGGWRDACKDLGLPTTGLTVRCREDSIEEGARATARLLDAGRTVDGIVALSDILALGALRELTRRGLTPGHDVGVTGFDDSPLAEVVSPGLTSLRQPMDQIAEELITILTGSSNGSPVERLLRPELVIRGSSAPG
jgi:DNA-binding LacI/PurR family transcriptional regulator